jgi:electron transfer flavoprotein alpha subunit
MADTILVVAEQREGRLNRVSLETIAAAQAIAAETGWSVEAAVFGNGISAVAQEIAGKKLAKVYDI